MAPLNIFIVGYVQGAREIWANLPGVKPYVRSGNGSPTITAPVSNDKEDDEEEAPRSSTDNNNAPVLPDDDPDFAAWLASLEKAGNKPPRAPWGSAHQMGTCRMSSHEDAGVVDAGVGVTAAAAAAGGGRGRTTGRLREKEGPGATGGAAEGASATAGGRVAWLGERGMRRVPVRE